MKKITTTLILILILLLVTGCTQKIEVLEVQEADANSVFDLVYEDTEVEVVKE